MAHFLALHSLSHRGRGSTFETNTEADGAAALGSGLEESGAGRVDLIN